MNKIEYAKGYVPLLDAVYKTAALTADLDGASELARQGANANELIVPMISMDGLANYSRSSGYVGGDVTITNETVTADYERGRKFIVDAQDDLDTAGVAFGRLAGEFIRTKVVPEIDAVRFAKYANSEGVTTVSGTLDTAVKVVNALSTAVGAMDDAEVTSEGRILYITPTLHRMIMDMDTNKSRAVLDSFEKVVKVPQGRFNTQITLNDGVSEGQTAGGYKATGSNINFLIIEKSAIVQFTKTATPKIVEPADNQDADAYIYGYRITAVNQVYKNKAAGVYVHTAV